MSLLAIKGIYENGHITLDEEVTTDQAVAVVITFLSEKSSKTNWESWFASMSQFSDDFMSDGREQPQAQDRWGEVGLIHPFILTTSINNRKNHASH